MFRPKRFNSTRKSFPRPTVKRNNYRPSFELLETRCLLSAIETVPGFAGATLGNTDDGSAGPVALGFTAHYSTLNFDHVFVNNNGNVTIAGPNGDAAGVNFTNTG